MAMQSMSEQECIIAIEQGQFFHADVADGAFTIKIQSDASFICTAIHDGHRVRSEIIENCALSEAERYFEEEPYTGEFIDALPITVIGRDSRYEYDLNRGPETAIYDEAWGKVVWKTPLTEEQKSISLEKHHRFYCVMSSLYNRVIQHHGGCLVYDIHSYNYKRKGENSPDFNIGTEQLDMEKFGSVINYWNDTLNGLALPGHKIRSALNEVFFGRGYQATIAKEFKNTLVLPTEFKKIFMNELNGEADEKLIENVKPLFAKAIQECANHFSGSF